MKNTQYCGIPTQRRRPHPARYVIAGLSITENIEIINLLPHSGTVLLEFEHTTRGHSHRLIPKRKETRLEVGKRSFNEKGYLYFPLF